MQSIKASRLFNLYDHFVPLGQDERVTIVHGPNGVGKTVLLGLVQGLLTGRLQRFARVPLHQLEIQLSDGSRLGYRKAPNRERSGDVEEGHIYLCDALGTEQVAEVSVSAKDISRLAAHIENSASFLRRVGAARYLDLHDHTEISALEVIQRYGERLPPHLRGKLHKHPEWYVELQKRVRVFFVEAQRLIRLGALERYSPYEHREWQTTVKHYAQDLEKKIRDTLATYASASQTLDQSFPERLLKGTSAALPPEVLKQRINELEEVRSRLKRLGLLQEDKANPFDTTALDNIDAARRSVLSLYVEDTQNKLAVLEDLARRVELLLGKINSKFQNKQVRIAPTAGVLVDGHDGQPLELDSLSSGEQHELVLLYDLLFRVAKNTLVLIDEPELSLHVLWQKRFLPDLLEIVATTNCDVLIATHSPYIVGDRADLMVQLGPNIEP